MNKIIYIGVNDKKIDLFEGQYKVENGMSYNSYLIVDEKTLIMDSVDYDFRYEWLENIDRELNGKSPDYIVIQHMEPDHSGSIETFIKKYPNVTVVGNKQIKMMLQNFFPSLVINNYLEVKENDKLSLGEVTLQFVFAPFVHWPEVMMTYIPELKALFSADGFGKFGALDHEEEWLSEARRYYIGIVGKYGVQVQNLLKKAITLDVKAIYPLHGPVLNENLSYYLDLYNKWSSYIPERDGIVIAYSSVYGNTKNASLYLKDKIKSLGYNNVLVYDLARSDKHEVIAQAFANSKLVLASITYNGGVFPHMEEFINGIVERTYQNRTVAMIENGSWAPVAAKVIKEKLTNCKNLNYLNTVKIKSALSEDAKNELDKLAGELVK